jgi:shikimate kinase
MWWFILGPSGVGKSSFGQYLAQEKNWLHLEIDQFPNDGINIHQLREPCDNFYHKKDSSSLVAELTQRVTSQGKAGGVATFPGNFVLFQEHITACRSLIAIFYLYGSAEQCINAFLKREQETGRNLSLDHWMGNNYSTHPIMSDHIFEHNRVNVFTHEGSRRADLDVFAELSARKT